jgi:hypothetical protein
LLKRLIPLSLAAEARAVQNAGRAIAAFETLAERLDAVAALGAGRPFAERQERAGSDRCPNGGNGEDSGRTKAATEASVSALRRHAARVP